MNCSSAHINTLLIRNCQYEEDKTLITADGSWSVFNTKIQDIYFVKIVGCFYALQEHDQHAYRVFDLTYTHAFLKQYLKTVPYINFKYYSYFLFL